jgi:hypothetical protein
MSNNPVQKALQWVVDSAVAISLLAALSVVYRMDRKGEGDPASGGSGGQLRTVVQEVPKPKPEPKPLVMALNPPQFDDMGGLLGSLGEGYGRYETLSYGELSDPERLKKYDIVFLTCRNDVPQDTKLKQAVRQYVVDGGTLYASDLWYRFMAETFLEFAAPSVPAPGPSGGIVAEVVDPGLRGVLGSTLRLNFEVNGWMPAAFEGNGLTTVLRGRYTAMLKLATESEVPLLVKFPVQKGTVIFTSFHNAKQNDESERKLLRYLVFMAATAQEDAKITETIAEGGLSPKQQNLLTASSNNPSVTQTYRSTKTGKLKFVLGFANRGARLKLTVVGPDGRTFEKEGTETFFHEVDNAPVGEWRYTVTALALPYANFPFKVTIAE